MKSIKFLNCLKVLCAAILLVCLSGFAMSVQATEIVDSGTCGENLTWTLDSEGTLTISGKGSMYDYSWDESPFEGNSNIKKVIIKKGVTSIGERAFSYVSNLTSVTVPNGVTSIGSCAFMDCYKLTSITIPDSVNYIGTAAFWCCDITSISIPEGVTQILDRTFSDCTNLTSVKLPESLTFIDVCAFSYCSKLSSINIPDSVTYIGSGAFMGCESLTSVAIPGGVTQIESNTFWGCSNLKSVTIPNGVTSIGDGAFGSCSSLTSVSIPSTVTYVGGAFNGCDKLQYTTYGNCKYLGNSNNAYVVLIGAVSQDTTSCQIHKKTKIIAGDAFYYTCVGAVTIPDGVTFIGDYAFNYCGNLSSIDIPDSVTTIGDYAFGSCYALTSVTIPDSLVNIGADIFRYSDNIETKEYKNGKYIGNETNPYLAIIGSSSESVTSCTIHPKTQYIFSNAFEQSALTSITIPESVTQIAYAAFADSVSLQSISIPESVTSIGSWAFAGCTGLTSVTIPEGVEAVDEGTFFECSSLSSITIPESVESIGYNAFSWCEGIKKIFFTGDYPSINKWSFYNVKANAYYPASNTTWTKNMLQNYNGELTWIAYNPLKITTQPKNGYAIINEYAKATVKVSGDGLTYQWYVKDIGDSKYSKSSQNTATYACKMSGSTTGRYAKCKITDQYGNVIWTNTVRLRMKDLAITSQSATQKVKEGKTATFKVVPNGTKVTYQWQYRTSSSGSWKNASATGNKTKTLSVPATVSRSGYQYRCKITDSAGNTIYSEAVYLYVLGIKTQPVSKTVVDGKTAKFTVSATGASKKYQWQYRTSSSGSWKNASATGNKTATLSVPATVSRHGYQYRCKITDSAGNVIYTKTVNLYVLGIKTQPVNKSVEVGATAKFTVTAVGKGLTYQWQYRTSSSGSWKNVSAASGKTANYSLTTAARHNGYQYRCKITDSAGNVIYTSIVKLTVKK